VSATISETSGSESANTSDVRITRGSYCYLASTMKSPATSSEAAFNKATKEYLFIADSKYYEAMEDDGTKSYSELTKAAFDTKIVKMQAIYYWIIEGFAILAYSLLDTYFPSTTSSASTSENVTSESTNVKTTQTYASTGDGNLTVNTTVDRDDSTAKGKAVSVLAFDAYYPTAMKEDDAGTAYSDSSTADLDHHVNISFHWDNCDQIISDLTQYSLAS